ncbi:MAG: GNAT family N-acetyltransferase [Legionellaceae bacterium]|nr:GNAT family N-acetyltransferase [Legionellaceae bacterium]
MITRVSQLTDAELTDIESLLAECKHADGNFIPIYKHLIDKRHPLACNVLCYQDKQLIGFLRTYFFYVDACEVALMVAPNYRRQGIASQLFREILPLLREEHINSLIFSTPPNLCETWLSDLGFSFRNSEYQMRYNAQKEVTTQIKPVTIRMATSEDIPILCAIDDASFPNKKTEPDALYQSLLQSSNCDLFALTQDKEVVGKIHVFTESDRIRLTDLAVFPQARGRGYGAALIKHCINHALVRNKTKIYLDVETTNESAIKVYNGLGFEITNSNSYWVTPKDATDFGLDVFIEHK